MGFFCDEVLLAGTVHIYLTATKNKEFSLLVKVR